MSNQQANKNNVVEMTLDEWSLCCLRQKGQTINNKRYAFIECNAASGLIGNWKEVVLIG